MNENMISITLLVSIVGAIIAISDWIGGEKKKASAQESHNATVLTKLEFISDDLRDIKSDQKAFKQEVREARDIAQHALERAESAHSRLDSIIPGNE